MKSYSKSRGNLKILANIVFVIFAVILSQIFHSFDMGGPMFLPMHIPVILAGFILGPIHGLVTGMITPTLSTFLTGMPVAFPMLPIMIFELGTYGIVAGILSKTKIKMIHKIILTMLIGRISYAIVFTIIHFFFTPIIQVNNVVSAIIVGLPGIAIQIIVIPTLYKTLKGRKRESVQSSKRINR